MSPGMDGKVFSEPDSTTAERDFVINDEVLCQIGGDLMYFGVVVQVNHLSKKCLVKFWDKTETWCNFSQMKQCATEEAEAEVVTCVVCKSSQPGHNNQLHVCACGRGYHERCHQPNIPPDGGGQWKCRICSPNSRRREVPERQPKPSSPVHLDVENEPQCGKCNRKSVWYRGMLQCRRCRLWFHSTCLHNVKEPPMSGDRFYVLVCSGCNRGRELCCRLILTWPDLIHLALFNLNLKHHTKYHDLDLVIMPLVNTVWDRLQLPPEIAEVAIKDRRRKVETTLRSCNRFRSGREVKKRATLWGLRLRGPPRSPPVSLPERGPVDEQMLATKKVLLVPVEKPLQNGHINSSRKEIEDVIEVAPPQAKVESSTEFLVKRSVPFPLLDSSNNAGTRFRSNAVRRAARLLRKRKSTLPERGCNTDDESLASRMRRAKRSDSDDEDGSRKRPRRQKQDSPRLSDSEDEALRTLIHDPSRTIARFITTIEEKKQKEIVNKRPQRNLLEARLNSTESKLYNPQATIQESPTKKKDKEKVSSKKCDNDPSTKILETRLRKRVKKDDEESNSSGDEPLTPVITKRRLSEKDIMVDGQGVVRRKRRKRRLSSFPLPPRTPSLYSTSQSAASSVSNEPLLSLDELYNCKIDPSYLRDYLCPIARVIEGKPYEVTTRRVMPNGEVHVMLAFANDDDDDNVDDS